MTISMNITVVSPCRAFVDVWRTELKTSESDNVSSKPCYVVCVCVHIAHDTDRSCPNIYKFGFVCTRRTRIRDVLNILLGRICKITTFKATGCQEHNTEYMFILALRLELEIAYQTSGV